MLLHGGGGYRQEWHEAGYVQRLQDEFTVITMDLRGHGQSGQPTDPAAYSMDKMLGDILAVADASGTRRFALWGMSYGGKVGRYLAVSSERVSHMILMGTPLGPGVTGQRRQEAVDFVAHWPPILKAKRDGNLDLGSLGEHDRTMLEHFDIDVMLGWVTAMLSWGAVEPGDFLCPSLWLVGSEDPHAMASVDEYRHALEGTHLQVRILKGLTHEGVFEEIDQVLPIMLAFTRAVPPD
jgi:pimeloyl-ACP methyl ester carboxylesterase